MVLVCGDALAQSARSPIVGRIGIGTIGPAGLPADLRIRLEDAAANGLKASGAEVVTATELARVRASAALDNCSNFLCEQRLAQVTDTSYWLRGTCQLDTSTYRLHLELVDARSGAVVVARDDTCDICTEADAAEMASVAASSLKAALGRTSAPSRAVESVPVAPTTAAPPGAAVARWASRHGEVKREEVEDGVPLWRRALPWIAFGAAAAAIAGAAYYLSINGQGSDCRGPAISTCRYLNDTIWQWGVPLLAVGGALATTGIVLLTIGGGHSASVHAAPAAATPAVTSSTTAKVTLSPTALTLSGSF
jgi:hypothetical protein